MSLPSKAVTARFTIVDRLSTDITGAIVISNHQLSVTNLRHPWEMVLWEERQGLSITGKRRTNNIIRGYDSRLEFDWADVRNQESEIKTFINAMKGALEGNDYIRFNVLGDTNYLFVRPDNVIFNQNYTNQVVRRTETSMSFEIIQLKDSIDYDDAVL